MMLELMSRATQEGPVPPSLAGFLIRYLIEETIPQRAAITAGFVSGRALHSVPGRGRKSKWEKRLSHTKWCGYFQVVASLRGGANS